MAVVLAARQSPGGNTSLDQFLLLLQDPFRKAVSFLPFLVFMGNTDEKQIVLTGLVLESISSKSTPFGYL
jgi:hypothetical protein